MRNLLEALCSSKGALSFTAHGSLVIVKRVNADVAKAVYTFSLPTEAILLPAGDPMRHSPAVRKDTWKEAHKGTHPGRCHLPDQSLCKEKPSHFP